MKNEKTQLPSPHNDHSHTPSLTTPASHTLALLELSTQLLASLALKMSSSEEGRYVPHIQTPGGTWTKGKTFQGSKTPQELHALAQKLTTLYPLLYKFYTVTKLTESIGFQNIQEWKALSLERDKVELELLKALDILFSESTS